MFDLSSDVLFLRLMMLPPMILSLTVHEWAHAWSAYRLGDDTAARQGRLTLSPLPHIDLIGTIALPLMGIPFGWAKPVPVNPARFDRGVKMRTGMMITAAAGPLSNVVMALLSAVLLGLLIRFGVVHLGMARNLQAVTTLLTTMISLNVALALFNLLPIPPLDGSRVVDGLLPYGARRAWESFTQYAPLVLIAVVLLSSRGIGITPVVWVNEQFYDLIDRIAG